MVEFHLHVKFKRILQRLRSNGFPALVVLKDLSVVFMKNLFSFTRYCKDNH